MSYSGRIGTQVKRESTLVSETHRFVCLVSLRPRQQLGYIYRGLVPRLTSDNFMCCHTRDRVGRPRHRSHYTDTDPADKVGSGRPQRGSNPGPPHQESRALPTELPRPPNPSMRSKMSSIRGSRGGGGLGRCVQLFWLEVVLNLYEIRTKFKKQR